MFNRLVLLVILTMTCALSSAQESYALVIHGGAGHMTRTHMSEEQASKYRTRLDYILDQGEAMLLAGDSAVDVVAKVISLLEDDPLFNAGRGAVLNAHGHIALDASIMDGRTGQAGAVAHVHRVKNPIRLARAVMEHSPHVLLVGSGAERFAMTHDIYLTTSEKYFITEQRREQYQKRKDHVDKGTVGAVVMDVYGHLAAGTSTGGMMMKPEGRVGDSPIIGAGTFADSLCAVSCTGHGEYFMRQLVAYDVSARMRYLDNTLHEATTEIINGRLNTKGGEGGLIAVDQDGNIAMPFNTSGMFRGYVHHGGKKVMIFDDEE